MKQILTILLLFVCLYTNAGEIIVRDGESIHDALRQAREWRRTNDARCQGGITIIIEEGRYYMNEPLFLRPEDSGTKESPLVIRGIGEKHTSVICGDPRQKHRQIWPLKEQDDGLPKNRHDDGLPTKGMERMISFNKEKRTITIPTPPDSVLRDFVSKNTAESTSRPPLEMVVHQRWAIAILRVKDIRVLNDSVTEVSFMEPESRLEFEHPWPQPVIGGERGNSSFLLRTTEQRDGIEQLVIVDGANYVRFEGLTFKHTCWNRPLHKGHVTLQGGFPLVDAYKLKENPGLPWDEGLENQAWIERPVSAVTVRNAHHVDFHSVLFENLAATALDFVDNVSDCVVQKCTFGNIGGTAIMGGSFAESPREVHRPYTDLTRAPWALHWAMYATAPSARTTCFSSATRASASVGDGHLSTQVWSTTASRVTMSATMPVSSMTPAAFIRSATSPAPSLAATRLVRPTLLLTPLTIVASASISMLARTAIQ